VIESLAAGVPCVCTPAAAEGFDFPEALQSCVAEGADGFAALIGHLHGNERDNGLLSQAGLDYVTRIFSPERLDAAMLSVRGPAALLQPIPNELGTSDRSGRAVEKTE
jgi:O-antigen biosynthesis protein